MFKTRFWDPPNVVARELEVELAPDWLLLQLWLKSCQGTGMSLPVVVDPAELLGVPTVLERLEGTVSRPDVDVSAALPDEDNERTANSMRPLCGSTMTSRMWPRVFPSCDCTLLFMSWLRRTLLPDCMELLLELY